MDLIDPRAEAYAEAHSPETDPALTAILREATNHPHAHMLSGALQGQLLEMIARLIAPTYILEIGTFLGYSALCLAKGLKPGGELHTLERDPATAAVARANFNGSPNAEKIILHEGNALDILPTLGQPWDIVFIDADKPGYLDYYEYLVPKLRPGALVMADNTLFHGQVLEPAIRGKNALAIHAFNERVSRDERVDKVMLTVRDGLFLIRKK